MTRATTSEVGEAIPEAVKLLERRIKQLADSGFLTGHQALGPSIQRAAAEIAHDQTTRSVPLTEERQNAFLLALAAGLSVSAAAALAGVARRTLYDHRENDSEFALQWENALEASIGNIEARLETIALQGDMNSMATVRAAEALLRARQRERPRQSIVRTTNDRGQRVNVILVDDGLTPD
jgi:hypothetical protein